MASTNATLEVGVLLVGDAVQFTDLAPVDMLAMLTPGYLAALGPAGAELQKMAVPMNVSYISEKGEGLFQLTAGARVAVTHSLATAPPLSILFVPGPPPTHVTSAAIGSFIRTAFDGGATVLSICTGILPVAASGILDGRVATAPLGLLAMLGGQFPGVEWAGEKRWARSADAKGEVWTSGGVANGIDLVCGFMRDRFADRRAMVETMIGMAGVGERSVEYSETEKAMGMGES